MTLPQTPPKKNQYYKIQRRWSEEGLDPSACYVMAVITSRCELAGSFVYSDQWLGEHINLSRATVSRIINALVKRKMLVRSGTRKDRILTLPE